MVRWHSSDQFHSIISRAGMCRVGARWERRDQEQCSWEQSRGTHRDLATPYTKSEYTPKSVCFRCHGTGDLVQQIQGISFGNKNAGFVLRRGNTTVLKSLDLLTLYLNHDYFLFNLRQTDS